MTGGQEVRAREFALAVRERCLGSRITRLHRLIALRYDQALAEVGLTLPQVEILSALLMRGRPVGPSEMGHNLAVGRSAMSRKLAALEQRGWVETTERSITGRSMAFSITADGIVQLAGAARVWDTVQAVTRSQLGAHAASAIDTWIDTLQADLDPPHRT